MLDPEKLANLDQAVTELTDFFPSMWWSLYDKSVKEGFTSDQAMLLVTMFSKDLLNSLGLTEGNR